MSTEHSWKISYWYNNKGENTVEQWLDSLSTKQIKSVAKEMKLLALCGNSLKLPHSRTLKNGLSVLRERQYGFRIYYTFLPDKRILMLSAGNKKTQKKDMDVARDRLDQLR